ncbi:E3 SUMO-protein ligase ZBED1-like [Pseudophryne corroboree]|uniref:E3 SUMO-protein ligase ZBED1-like n=1 Tax=Pseudophryne corroboree TaxID=495146 RepID=UPI0030812656
MVIHNYKMASGLATTTRRKREKVDSLDVTASNLSVDLYKSKMWNFYTKLGDAYVECKVCKKQLSSRNNTTLLREHLVRRHSFRSFGIPNSKDQLELDVPDQEGAAKRLRQTLPVNSLCSSESRAQVVANLMLEMIFLDLHPLSLVEDEGFSFLLGYLEPNVVLPCPTQLAGMLWHKYTVVKQQLKCCLHAAHSVVLSTESWTNHSKMSCLAITANVIDKDWRLCRYVLETQHVLQSKTEGSLAKRLSSVLEEFGLPSTLISNIVHDRLVSMSAHADSLKDTHGWTSLCCTSHVLQLCVQAGLEVQEVSEALCAARGLVSYFQEDYKASCYLSAKLEAMNKPRLVLDSQMYWISTLEMCQNLLDLKWAILSILEEQTVQNLSEQHWKLLQDLVPMLKTIWIATEFLQEEQNASISSLMPCVHGILTVVGQTSEGSSILKAAASEICAEIYRNWDMLDEGKLITNPSAIASFLDPRFKDLRFLKPWARGELHMRVRNMLLQMCEPSSTNQPWSLSCVVGGGTDASQLSAQKVRVPTVGSENVYDLLLGKDPTESMPEAHQQLEDYILEPICKRTTDPLGWWKINQHRFPTLVLLARQYLAIPVTAVKPAHAFSTKLDSLTKRRAALDLKNMDQILFLHQNKDLLERGVKASE